MHNFSGLKITLPETNSKFAPENPWLDDESFALGQIPSIFQEYLITGFSHILIKENGC